MPKISAGNRLYLYRLLSRELGVGKQTLMSRAQEALEADNIWPQDLGFDDMRSLADELNEFIKVTVFKKGYIYVTVLANADYDAMLEKAGKGGGEKAPAGKSWKKKGGKVVKPLKPKHIETVVEPEPEPVVEAEPEPEPEPVAEVEETNEAQVETVIEEVAEKTVEAEVVEEPAVEAEAEPEPVAEPEPEPEPAPEPDPTPAPLPEAPTSVPSISLTITYAPEPLPEPELDPEPAPAPAPQPATPARPQRAHSDLPQDFYADVRCPDEHLSRLYQLLPAGCDPMAVLEEDFHSARSTHQLEGTRSNVTFPLRFQKADGTPAQVTLKKTVRAQGGKRWAVSAIDADEVETVGLEGMARKAEGAWCALAQGDDLTGVASPEEELSRFAVLGSWDKLLGDLAALAEPENWGADLGILKQYLCMVFHRVQAQGRLSMTDDGSSASFDTGLVTAEAEPIAAVFEPCDGQIAWELMCFSTNAQGRPATFEDPFAQADAPASLTWASIESLPAHTTDLGRDLRLQLQKAARNPRHATLAYDALGDRVVKLVPASAAAGAKVAALLPDESNNPQVAALLDPADAYVCARVASNEQPEWLRRAAFPQA